MIVWLALLGAAPACPIQAAELARVSTVPAPAGARVRQALLADLDADGRLDLLLVASPEEGGQRTLYVHRGRAEAPRFAPSPDQSLALTADVVALSIGDVHADPGLEVVLWSARGVFAWRPRAQEKAGRFARLAEVDLLWQVAPDDAVLLWRAGVRDLGGDGLPDLLVPEPGGYRVFVQSRGAEGAVFTAEPRLALDPALLASTAAPRVETSDSILPGDSAGARYFDFSFGGSPGVRSSNGPLLALDAELPAPQLFDWDKDGDQDCLAQTARELLVWRLGGKAEEAPLRIALPFEVDRGRKLDVSYAAAVAEIDGDGRADCVIFAGDKRASDVRTQVLVFTHAGDKDGEPPLFGAAGRPAQLLVLAGFAGDPRLSDVNGDGRPDLIAGAMRPDLLETLTGGGDTIELELDVFLNGKGRFSAKPDLAARVRVAAEALDGGVAVRFVADVSGDGVQDLLVRGTDEIALHVVRPKRGGGLELLSKPVWTLALDEDDDVEVEAPGQLLLLGEGGVKHVELGP